MLSGHLVDEASDRMVDEVAFKFIPTANQASGASLLQLEEGPQGAEGMVANGPLPAHEELLGMTGLLEGPMVALHAPVLTMNVMEKALGHLHTLFFRGSYCA